MSEKTLSSRAFSRRSEIQLLIESALSCCTPIAAFALLTTRISFSAATLFRFIILIERLYISNNALLNCQEKKEGWLPIGESHPSKIALAIKSRHPPLRTKRTSLVQKPFPKPVGGNYQSQIIVGEDPATPEPCLDTNPLHKPRRNRAFLQQRNY